MRYSNIPGDEKAEQLLDVWYYAGYAQDEWRPGGNVTVTAGLRFDVASFKNTAFQNPAADALTFRDEDGSPVQFQTGNDAGTKVLWSPRVGINWDVAGDQKTQVRGGTGVFTGKPAYVWVSNQIGNTGVLISEIRTVGARQRVPVRSGSGSLQAGGDRRPERQLHAERHRSGLQVPAGVAHQRRRGPEAAGTAS